MLDIFGSSATSCRYARLAYPANSWTSRKMPPTSLARRAARVTNGAAEPPRGRNSADGTATMKARMKAIEIASITWGMITDARGEIGEVRFCQAITSGKIEMPE
jgi:hypothetical protein